VLAQAVARRLDAATPLRELEERHLAGQDSSLPAAASADMLAEDITQKGDQACRGWSCFTR
jgi:hypothetical protein